MEAIISQCGGVGKGPGEDLQACKPIAPTVSQENSWDCRYEGKIPNESVLTRCTVFPVGLTFRDVGFGRPIDKLPGCNPAWPKGMDAKPTCDNPPADPELVFPNVYFRNLLVSLLHCRPMTCADIDSKGPTSPLSLPKLMTPPTPPPSRLSTRPLSAIPDNPSMSLGDLLDPTRIS
jgi:hypothetical protein